MKSRTIFIGDVHGCRQELEDLLEVLSPKARDRVILLGDLINRGPDSAGTVRLVHAAGFECLLGNHEEDYRRHAERPVYRTLRAEIGETLHEWLCGLPLFLENEHFLAVHAGLHPGRHPADTPARLLLHLRTWDGHGRNLRDPGNPAWYELYEGERPVFYGHWARAGLNIRRRTFGLDSGCVYGRRLSAYVLEEQHVIQVRARGRHYIPPSLR